MREPIQTSPALLRDGNRTGREARSLPALAAVILVGVSLYAGSAQPARDTAQPVVVARAEAQEGEASPQTQKAVAAAEAFLKSLDEIMRGKALADFDSPKRAGWSNLPVTMVPRNGVRLGDLSKAQRDAAMKVVASVLSKEGYQKMLDIMNGDQMLALGKGGGKGPKDKGPKDKGPKDKGPKGKGGKAMFGNDQYYLAIFGKPSPTRPWLVQFGGHHLGLNVTVVGKSFVLTPTHTGAQPDTFTWEGKTVRPLGDENDRAFKLINALDAKQQAQAILGTKPGNLILGPGQDGKTIDPKGIKGSALNEEQRKLLLDLIAAWVNILPGDAASARLAEIKTALPDTYFAWQGPTANGSAVYYRVQGPTVVIEYAPQGGINHIHTIIRDPSNDYGAKLTRR